MSEFTVEECRLRGITLTSDDLVAQDIVDEEEAWLAARIGLLTGSRTETFYVGLAQHRGKLALSRYTDEADVTDGGVAVSHFRLVDRGSAIHHTYSAASQWWTGPYVEVTYSPNDELRVRSALFDLVALAAQSPTPYASETIGSYSYSQGGQFAASAVAQRAIIVGSLLPKHDPLVTIHSARRIGYGDPVINRAEAAT